MNFRTNLSLCTAALALACAGSASATSFSGTGLPSSDAAFSGGSTTATFTQPNQSFSSYTENGITISAGRIDDSYADQYNSFGSYYDNNAGALGTISFSFASPTSAFAFNWGAADNVWNMDIFSGASLLGSLALTPTFGSNAKEYFGFSGSNITSAVLTQRGSGDWVFVENLTVATGNAQGAVPEPATWAMMLLGFAVVGGAMRSRQKQNVSVRYA